VCLVLSQPGAWARLCFPLYCTSAAEVAVLYLVLSTTPLAVPSLPHLRGSCRGSCMCCVCPQHRLDARGILTHEWFRAQRSSASAITEDVGQRIGGFNNKLRRKLKASLISSLFVVSLSMSMRSRGSRCEGLIVCVDDSVGEGLDCWRMCMPRAGLAVCTV
jgi:hypothetical protein